MTRTALPPAADATASGRGWAAGPPDCLPLLSRGRHRDPARGACLLEATALLAGEPPTDRPASVHPVLAALARVVNDSVSDATRQALLALAPQLIGTAATDPDPSRALVALCCERARTVAPPIWVPRLRRDAHRAEAGARMTRRHAARSVALAGASLAIATGADRDAVLTQLLRDAIRLCGG
jgi:hypothetical protein